MDICGKVEQLIAQVNLINPEELMKLVMEMENVLLRLLQKDNTQNNAEVGVLKIKISFLREKLNSVQGSLSSSGQFLEQSAVSTREKKIIALSGCVEVFVTEGNQIKGTSRDVAEKIEKFGYLWLLLQSLEEVCQKLDTFETSLNLFSIGGTVKDFRETFNVFFATVFGFYSDTVTLSHILVEVKKKDRVLPSDF